MVKVEDCVAYLRHDGISNKPKSLVFLLNRIYKIKVTNSNPDNQYNNIYSHFNQERRFKLI
jgi:hypothetical protein